MCGDSSACDNWKCHVTMDTKRIWKTKLSYFVFQYPLIWLVVGLCCLAGISFAVPAGLYMLEKSHCEQ